MKNNSDNKKTSGPCDTLSSVFCAATGSNTRHPMSSTGSQFMEKDPQTLQVLNQEQMIEKVGQSKKAFEMSLHFFAFQVFSSSVANIVGTVLGHPLDTIRVRMQLEQGQSSFMRTCTETFRGEGMGGFFKGLVSPVVGVTPYNTLVFTITEAMKNELGNRYEDMSEENKSFVSGSFAGGVSLVIYNPVELLKVRAQVNRIDNMKYTEAIPELIRSEGYAGLYKGFGALVCRDIPGWGVYFWTYEVLKKYFGIYEAKKQGTDNSALNMLIKMWAAGVAGQASWIVSYPFDIVKTQIQCTESRRVGMMEVSRRIHAAEGTLGFFKGLSPSLARSFVVNSVALPAFEYLNDRYMYGPSDDVSNGERRQRSD